MNKPYAPAADRNRDPILEILRGRFADRRSVLEIGSGTGQHAVYFAAALSWLTWQTSDVSAVMGARWTLVVERAGADGSVVGVWRAGCQAPEATAIRFEGDRLFVLTPQGERARFRRTPEGTLDGVVRPAGSNANSVPVTLVRS